VRCPNREHGEYAFFHHPHNSLPRITHSHVFKMIKIVLLKTWPKHLERGFGKTAPLAGEVSIRTRGVASSVTNNLIGIDAVGEFQGCATGSRARASLGAAAVKAVAGSCSSFSPRRRTFSSKGCKASMLSRIFEICDYPGFERCG
jgi:hypothetical protein